MAQKARNSKLEGRTSRLSLTRGKRYVARLNGGVALVYRRTKESGFGTWSAKITQSDGTYHLERIADADDHQEANGADVLTFAAAQKEAIRRAEDVKRTTGRLGATLTVDQAGALYLDWFKQHRRTGRETENAYNVHIAPALGDKLVSTLTATTLRNWHEAVAAQPARIRTSKFAKAAKFRAAPLTEDGKRARRATANRVLTILKAILNKAFHDGLTDDDTEWRKVKPFKGADEARIRFLTDDEAIRLANACTPDLRALVRGALLTGARFGELANLRAHDVDVTGGRIYISETKSGKPRHIPLNPEGVEHFRTLISGKTGDHFVFIKSDGTRWGTNHHVRGLKAACRVAKVRPAIAFHELRHTYASHLAQAGVELLTISKLLGHADTRITAKHYAHLADKTLVAAVAKLPSFNRGNTPLLAEVSGQKTA